MDKCVSCCQPLTLEIDSDDEAEDAIPMGTRASEVARRTVPDSVELTCGCFFHWSVISSMQREPSTRGNRVFTIGSVCLTPTPISDCPRCGANIVSTSDTGQEQVLCNLNNEGGLQEGLDIMPLLVEASYLKTYPEERRGRAFVEFAGEGDVISMLDILKEDAQDGGEEDAIDLLRYQDPIGGMSSALHAAVSNNNVTVAWLLLWLASSLDTAQFPQEIVAQAQGS